MTTPKIVLLFIYVSYCPCCAGDDLSDAAKVASSGIVKITTDGNGNASVCVGFVVREDGVIATSLQAISTAKHASMKTHAGIEYTVTGVLAELSDKNIALIQADTKGDRLPFLKVAHQVPEQGTAVFTFKDVNLLLEKGIVTGVTQAQGLTTLFPGDAIRFFDKAEAINWILTDIEAFNESVGAPLLNYGAEVVGMMALELPKEKPLCIAISAREVDLLLASVTEGALPLPAARTQIAIRDELVADLEPFSAQAVVLPAADRDRLAAAGAFVITYESGEPFAVIEHSSGRMHGRCYAQHENGMVMMNGTYEKGERDGVFRISTTNGAPLLDVLYHRGNKNGILCFYREGAPALIQECSRGKVLWSHRLERYSVVESVDHSAGDGAAASIELRALQEGLEALENQLKVNEISIKKMVRGLEEDRRKRLAASRGQYTQRLIQDRHNARTAEREAVIGQMRRICGFFP